MLDLKGIRLRMFGFTVEGFTGLRRMTRGL